MVGARRHDWYWVEFVTPTFLAIAIYNKRINIEMRCGYVIVVLQLAFLATAINLFTLLNGFGSGIFKAGAVGQVPFSLSLEKQNDESHQVPVTITKGTTAKTLPPSHMNETIHDLCSRDEIKVGSWVPVQMKRPPYVSKTLHLRCYPLESYKTGIWNTYKWQPSSSSCKFGEWSSEDFCSLMKLATVLIIGDSLSWEHFSSLGQLLGLRIHQSSQFTANETNFVKLGCKQRTRLAFRRDDILSHVGEAIEETFPQVVVINRGAHYQNDTKLLAGLRNTTAALKAWQEKCKTTGVKCHLFWRTSVPGHPLCAEKNFTAPNNNLAEMEAWIANRSNYNNHTINYHWYDYQHQNNLILETLRQDLGPDAFEVIDAYYLNILRPDEHRAHQGDCLHNCYPGKMDVYSQLMLHFLRKQRTEEDVVEILRYFQRTYPNVTTSITT